MRCQYYDCKGIYNLIFRRVYILRPLSLYFKYNICFIHITRWIFLGSGVNSCVKSQTLISCYGSKYNYLKYDTCIIYFINGCVSCLAERSNVQFTNICILVGQGLIIT